MTKPVEITLPSRTFTCDKNGKASVIFTVTNIFDEDTELAASIYIDENEETAAQAEWFDIKVDSNWTLGSKTTEEVKVDVTIPNAQPMGDYKFKLTIYAKENPGDDFTTSEMVLVKKAEIPIVENEKKPFPWWIVAVVAALLVVVGIVWYIVSSEPEPKPEPITQVILPDVQKMKLSDALLKLNKKGLVVDISKIRKQFNNKLAEDIVVNQVPDPDKTKKVEKGSKVDLTVSTKLRIMVGKPIYFKPAKVQLYKSLQTRELEKIE